VRRFLSELENACISRNAEGLAANTSVEISRARSMPCVEKCTMFRWTAPKDLGQETYEVGAKWGIP